MSPPPETARVRHDRDRTAWTTLGLSLAFLPFLLTQHVQEDAYITFRCARTLADTGVYGVNPGETVSACTSHLAVLVAAAARVLAGERFIEVVQVVYALCAVLAARGFVGIILVEGRLQRAAWPAFALLPSMLMVGYSGMETALLLLLVTVLLSALTSPGGMTAALTAAALLPWVRPDAAALVLLLVLTLLVRRDRVPAPARAALLGVLAGTLGWLLFNRVLFGEYLTQSVLAKTLVWSPKSPSDAWSLGASQLRALWFGDESTPAMFLPVHTRYLGRFGLIATALVGLASAFLWASPHRSVSRRGLAALAGMAFLLPLPYAFLGRVYPWYVWPGTVAGHLLVLTALLVAAERAPGWARRHLRRVGAALVAVMAAAQWGYAVNWGTQERLYRGGIGETLARRAAPGDTLLLEPAGYIPFFARMHTWDEVGLTTPAVTEYRRRFGTGWWPRFVADRRPTWILAREPFADFVTLDGYRLTADERSWFAEHYVLAASFAYEPDRLRHAPLLRAVARRGRAGEYLLYSRR